MKNAKTSSVQNPNEIPAELLRENTQILLLPSGAIDGRDSNYEPYLDCPKPESAICLSTLGVAVSDGCDEVKLLRQQRNRLSFVTASRGPVPDEVKWLLNQLFENLDGHPTRGAAIDFVEWLHAKKPTSMGAVVGYFLANAECWLIGLPTESASKRLFTQPSIQSGSETGVRWYRLVDLQMASHLALA